MAQISVQIDGLTDSIRRLIEDMRPGMLDVLGLVAAIEEYAYNFSARTGIACELDASNDEIKVSDEIGIGIFRIVQEALNNVQKYAEATRVSIELQRGDQSITLRIQDNGKGFAESSKDRKGFGLMGMRERECSTFYAELTDTYTPTGGALKEPSTQFARTSRPRQT